MRVGGVGKVTPHEAGGVGASVVVARGSGRRVAELLP